MHTSGQFREFIERCFGGYQITGSGNETNINVVCPICYEANNFNYQKKKLAIKLSTGILHCWVCGYKARSIYGLLRRYKPIQAEEFITQFDGASLVSDDEEKAFKKELEVLQLPTGFQLLAEWLDNEDSPAHIRQATKYLKQRGLTEHDFWYFKFGVTELDKAYKNRVIVPSHDVEGNLNFFTARSYKSFIKPKYFNPRFRRETVVFNEINIDWDEELTIVEGPFDMFKVNDNATCLLGKELTKQCALFQAIVTHTTPVLLCLDNDAMRATLDTAKLLYDYNIDVKILELPEEIKDPGEISRDKFLELRETNAVEFDEMYYLRNIIK